MTASAADPAHFRQVLGHFATGVTIITAMEGGEPVGMAASSFTSLSLEPPMVLFCAGKTSSTWPRIQRAKAFCVNVLADTQEVLSRQFAGKGDKYAGVGWRPGATGSPVLDRVLAWIDCETEAEYDGGDHVIVVGRVVGLDAAVEQPLLYYRGGYGRYQA